MQLNLSASPAIWRYLTFIIFVLFNLYIFTTKPLFVSIFTSISSIYFLIVWDRFKEIVTKPTPGELWGKYKFSDDLFDAWTTIVGIVVSIVYFIAFLTSTFTIYPWYFHFIIAPLMLMFPILHIIALVRFWAEKKA